MTAAAVYVPPLAEHVVMVGPDWWTCLWWHGARTPTHELHTNRVGAEVVHTDWEWADVRDVGTPDEVHRWLWEQNAI